ncbi:hypothetical protein [Streptomyces sp. NPDC002588]|uniref:hypothetical protein n=1 Tax=Streptomyces sp. NPDC002588 TaxID=3154419 RepID=UPI003326AD28
MAEILSYLAVALPADISAGARLLALQCALRMNAYMRVELPAGLLRGLRISVVEACHELAQAGWLSVVDGPGPAGIAAEIRDVLTQSPARPDRRRAADWAMRRGCPARTGATEPQLRLLGVYLSAHGEPSSGEGLIESDRVVRGCGIREQEFQGALSRLTASGFLNGWRICLESEDLYWTLAPGQR